VSPFRHGETISTEVWHGWAEVGREVILSAGAVGSPHILQLSGVGDPEHLAKIGVPVVHELRGVGKNMQDHYTARVSHPVVGAQTANERSRGPQLAGEVMRWLFTGKGILTYSASIVAASVNVLEESATPDMQCTFAPGSWAPGRCGHCRAAMSGPSRTGWARCRHQSALPFGGGRPARHHRRLGYSLQPMIRGAVGRNWGMASRPHLRAACAPCPARKEG
jgi:choline dehydrogenase-like flavoprotein